MPKQETNLQLAERLAYLAREDMHDIPLAPVERLLILATLSTAFATIAVAKGEKE